MKHWTTTLITGASAGLGEEFARQLAPRTRQLVLVARRRSRLEDLARALRGANPGLDVHVFEADLADDAALGGLIFALAEAGLVPDLLVNNAGLGDYGEFADSDWDRVRQMIEVNVSALTRLCHAVAPAMAEMGRGDILNVSSLASLLPIPDFAVYAATKAYVTSLSEALRIELAGRGIRVLALCPGPVPTEFGQVARRPGGADPISETREWFTVSRGQVVSGALRALVDGRARHFPGWAVALAAAGIGLLPMVVLRAALAMRPRRVDGKES